MRPEHSLLEIGIQILDDVPGAVQVRDGLEGVHRHQHGAHCGVDGFVAEPISDAGEYAGLVHLGQGYHIIWGSV